MAAHDSEHKDSGIAVPARAMKALIVTAEGLIAWKIATVPHGSEGLCPQDDLECPYFLEHRCASSCVSGSGGSMCGGFMGGTTGFVYCTSGLSFEDPTCARSRDDW
jgi:hypothetical protein